MPIQKQRNIEIIILMRLPLLISMVILIIEKTRALTKSRIVLRLKPQKLIFI
ncbi:MAG: hypothetical protein ACJA1N_000226 [Saprospiraceae bacterium]|jgi:hypothetical protein